MTSLKWADGEVWVRKDADTSQPITQLSQLEGRWQRQADMATLGEIICGQMLWGGRFRHPPSKLRLSQSTILEMDMSGSKHEGIVLANPSLIVRWGDGDVW